jgi:hypothetical protein
METCRHCGPTETWIRHRSDAGPQTMELCCKTCNAYIKWVPKEKNKEKLLKRPKYPSPEKMGIDYCEMCLMPKKYLLPYETLETHHRNGDPTNNDISNYLVICSNCHSIINHQRTYRMKHNLVYRGVYDEWITELKSLGVDADG